MSIRTYKQTNDLCLLRMDKYYFIGCLDLPQKEWTVSQYNEWLYKTTVNLISLDQEYVPQILTHAGFTIVDTMADACEYWRGHYGTSDEEFNKIGSFKELLIKLLYVTDGNYRDAFINHFERFYQEF